MSPNTTAPLPEVIRLATIGSTNSEALARARQGQAENTWYVAREQTEGRGRSGRAWTSAPGGLYATCLMVSRLPIQKLVGLTLVAGIAVYDTAAAHIREKNRNQLMLKWPNDLLANQHKLAGILIETEPLGGDRTAIAIGIGLNVTNGVETLDNDAISLSELGGTCDIDRVFPTLAACLAGKLSVWDGGRGFSAVSSAWESRAMARGTPTQVRLPDTTIKGTYAGLDRTGALRLKLASGETRLIHAGEINIAPQCADQGVTP